MKRYATSTVRTMAVDHYMARLALPTSIMTATQAAIMRADCVMINRKSTATLAYAGRALRIGGAK